MVRRVYLCSSIVFNNEATEWRVAYLCGHLSWWFAFPPRSAFAQCDGVPAILAASDLYPSSKVVAFGEVMAVGHFWRRVRSVVVWYVASFDMLLLMPIKIFGVSSLQAVVGCSDRR
jgi:hypothetical protein